LDSTKRNSIVLDPYLGSGTTILAAERSGRNGYGIEIDPIYVDTAIERWEKMSGHRARHASGQTFAEIKAMRAQDEAQRPAVYAEPGHES
jgi:DNA modification methylase